MNRSPLLRLWASWIGLSLSLSAVTLCGCSDATPQRRAITGQVTLDGQAVQDATIIFTPQGEGLGAAASIVDGSFALNDQTGPTQGQFAVRINPNEAELVAAEGQPAQLTRANRRPRIPKAYQRDGKLTATITDEHDQALKFELSTRER